MKKRLDVLLVERGSHMDGEYRIASVRPGTVRIPVLWTRIRTPNAVTVDIESPGTGPLGESGVDGYVVAGRTLEAELPRTVAAAVERDRARRQILAQAPNGPRAGGAPKRWHSDRVEEPSGQSDPSSSTQPAAMPALAGTEEGSAAALARATRICLALQERLLEIEAALDAAEMRRTADARSISTNCLRI